MDRIDGILAARLLDAFGSWRRVAALLHLERRGRREAAVAIEEAIGADLTSIGMQPGGRISDHVRGRIDYLSPDPGSDDILLSANLEIGPGVGWNGIHLLTPEGAYPETLRTAIDGCRASDLIEHPEIPSDAVLHLPTEVAPERAYMRIEGIPTFLAPKARMIDILTERMRMRIRCAIEGWRIERTKVRKKSRTWPAHLAMAFTLLINARFLYPPLRPHGSGMMMMTGVSLGFAAIFIALYLDQMMGHPISLIQQHVIEAIMAHEKGNAERRERRGF